MKKSSWLLGAAVAGLFVSCQKDISDNSDAFSLKNKDKAPAFGTLNFGENFIFYALGEGNRLDKFSLSKAEELIGSVTISNLQSSGEKILAIDFRPATGQLYAISDASRLYFINLSTGRATAVGSSSFTPALSGSLAGFDFNPTVDRIRVVTSTGQNLRLNPETGAVAAEDGSLNGVSGAMVTSVAYTNNRAGVTTTTLYDIDVATDKLYKQDPPNNGTLVEVGPLMVDLQGEGGFDIAPAQDGGSGSTALAIYRFNNKTALFYVDLETGRAKKIEKFDKEAMYYGIAIPTNPVAYAVSGNNLLILNPEQPSAPIVKNITGLQAGETIEGIDFRPATSALYALGSNSRLYTINLANGMATFVATLSVTLNGTQFGFDFNPVPDRIRIISNTGQNLRVVPTTGAATIDGSINPAPASITAAGYTNSFAGTTTTMLYVIDSESDMLYLQSPPNDGTLTNGKSLGVNVTSTNGFDIGGATNNAYGIFTADGITKLYKVNVMAGTLEAVGSLPGTVSGFALGLGF